MNLHGLKLGTMVAELASSSLAPCMSSDPNLTKFRFLDGTSEDIYFSLARFYLRPNVVSIPVV